jgi:hypothetical protein
MCIGHEELVVQSQLFVQHSDQRGVDCSLHSTCRRIPECQTMPNLAATGDNRRTDGYSREDIYIGKNNLALTDKGELVLAVFP